MCGFRLAQPVGFSGTPTGSRYDLTKEQRDQHIRRYAELLEARQNRVTHSAAPEIGYKKPPAAKKGIARQIADETSLSKDTIRRALKPKPARRVIEVPDQLGHDDMIQLQAMTISGGRVRPAK